jgi:hypothetical protein
MTKRITWPKAAIALTLDVWDTTVWLMLDPKTRDAVAAYLSKDGLLKWDKHSPHGWASHLVNDVSGAHCFVAYVGDGELVTLVHELDHATFMVLNSAGVLDLPNNQEPHTYTLGCLLRQALKARKWKSA